MFTDLPSLTRIAVFSDDDMLKSLREEFLASVGAICENSQVNNLSPTFVISQEQPICRKNPKKF